MVACSLRRRHLRRDAQRTLLGYVGRSELDAEFVTALERIDYGGTMARVYLAVTELPRYEAAPHEGSGPAAVHRAFALLGADLDRFRAAHRSARAGAIPEDPVLELSIQSTDDASLARTGTHTLNIGMMHVPWKLASGHGTTTASDSEISPSSSCSRSLPTSSGRSSTAASRPHSIGSAATA